MNVIESKDNIFLENRPELQDFLESNLVGLFTAIFSEKTGLKRENYDIAEALDSKARFKILELLTIKAHPDVTLTEIEVLAVLPPKVAQYLSILLCRFGVLIQKQYGSIRTFRLRTENMYVNELRRFMMQLGNYRK